jgi:hypothetical protein
MVGYFYLVTKFSRAFKLALCFKTRIRFSFIKNISLGLSLFSIRFESFPCGFKV